MGDATDIQTSKSAVTTHIESGVISDRLMGIDSRFDGRTHCPFEFGYHKVTFVISSYTEPAVKLKPSTFNYIMKLGMTYLAWQVLRGNMDWLFNICFSITEPAKLNKKIK